MNGLAGFVAGLIFCALPGLVLAEAPVSVQQDQLEEGLVVPGYHEKPDWFKESFLDIREDIAEAAAQGKRVLLYFYQDGCPYCARLLDENFSQKAIVDKTRKGFDVIAINMWGDREVTGLDGKETTEKQFAVDNKIMFTPTLLFLDENGKHVLRLNGYYPPNKFMIALDYVAGKHEKTPYRDYLAKNAPAPTSGKIHTEHANLKGANFAARTGGKPLIVMFEQKNCEACDELHDDILQQPESRKLLKSYDVAVLDMWSKTPVTTPTGEKTTVKQWAKKLHVQYAPSMVFFDQSGKEVFRTEAWLRRFHAQSALDYVASGAYKTQPEFQRYIEARADALRAKGVAVDIMK